MSILVSYFLSVCSISPFLRHFHDELRGGNNKTEKTLPAANLAFQWWEKGGGSEKKCLYDCFLLRFSLFVEIYIFKFRLCFKVIFLHKKKVKLKMTSRRQMKLSVKDTKSSLKLFTSFFVTKVQGFLGKALKLFRCKLFIWLFKPFCLAFSTFSCQNIYEFQLQTFFLHQKSQAFSSLSWETRDFKRLF